MTRRAMTGRTKSGHSRRMHGLALLALVGACVVTGCGARTLPGGDGQEDGQAPVADTDATAAPSANGPKPQFFVCPFALPPTDSTCDAPGQICVYEGFSSCQAVECDGSSHWQPGQQGC